MKIKFLGAAGTVTGSSYVLTSGSGRSILVDLGMFQGLPQIEKLNYQPFACDCRQLVGVVLTHAHLDHCGRLPILLPKGFKGNIYMTAPTRDLTELSLYDTAKIAKQDQKPFLFDKPTVEQTIERFKNVEYHTPFQIGDFRITMRDAGHILGSTSLEVEDLQPNSAIRKIVMSGDLGNTPEDLQPPTEMITNADAVVMESTYGDRLHPDLDPADAIQAEMNQIERSGGTLLIPAFSLEKTQELLHIVKHLKESGRVSSKTPFFLDSPMAEKATQIYLQYPTLFNSHIQAELQNTNPFAFPGLEVVMNHKQSEALVETTGPKIIMAGSGMMTGGRIVGHAAQYLPISSTRLFILGYQGEGTLGRELLNGSKEVMIDRMPVTVNATINSTQAMSSHADQDQLLNWLKQIKNVQKVFLTHGEDVSRNVLAKKITNELQLSDITMPILNQEVEL